MNRKTVWAYGDETGDRGLSSTASPIFGMATIIGNAQTMSQVKTVVKDLRSDFGVPTGEVMSWKKHLKTHERRLHAAKSLARIEDLLVVYALTRKADLYEGSFQNSQKDFYDFVAACAYKATLWAARSMEATDVRIRFGRVRGVDHARTLRYIEQTTQSDPKVPTHLQRELSWVGADQHFESEAADFYAGFMKTAFWPDAFGNVDDVYLKHVWGQIRKNPQGCAIPLGLFTMPSYQVAFEQDWFSCVDCPAQLKAK